MTNDTCKEHVAQPSKDGNEVSRLSPSCHRVSVPCVHLLLLVTQNANMQGEPQLNQCDSHTMLANLLPCLGIACELIRVPERHVAYP